MKIIPYSAIAMKQTMKRRLLEVVVVALLLSDGSVKASGIDSDAHAKSVSMSFFVGLTVRAEVDAEGRLGALVIGWSGKEIELAKSELVGLDDIDLQTMKVERDAGRDGDGRLSMVAVSFLYGEERKWEVPGLGDQGKIWARPCVTYLIADGRYVARNRVVPAQNPFEWATFVKLLGDQEANDGVERCFCPTRRSDNLRMSSMPDQRQKPPNKSPLPTGKSSTDSTTITPP